MPEHTSKDRIPNDCEAINAFAGRTIETVNDLAKFAAERGMKPSEVLAAARHMDDVEVERQAAAETTEQVSCLMVHTGGSPKPAQLTTFDIFQDGEQVHATRLIITDTDGHDAWLDLAPYQVRQVGEWLIRECQRLESAKCEQVSA